MNNELTVTYKINDETINLTPSVVQNYLVGTDAKITQQEFILFSALCKNQKLNPFIKEAYLIKFGDKPAQMVVGKDVIVKRAIKNPNYNGKESGVIIRKDDKIEERIGCFVAPNEELLGGWCRVYRKDWQHPEYMSVSVSEVAQRKSNGELNSNWTNKTATMVEKVAKVRALREAFINDLSQLYDADEFKEEKSPIKEVEIVENDPLEETETINIDEL